MSACNFIIPFTGNPGSMLDRAKAAIHQQGGTFTGDSNAGMFALKVMGSEIKGSYTFSGQELNVSIDSKPFLIPCSTIEGFLKKQLTGS